MVLPLFGIHASLRDNVGIGACFYRHIYRGRRGDFAPAIIFQSGRTKKGSAMKTYLCLFALLFLFGCESNQVAAPDPLFQKSTRKCLSAGYEFYGLLTWYPVLLDMNTTPPDTLATYDLGYIVAEARECDALYLASNYGGLMVFDLSHPANAYPVRTLENQRQFSGFRVQGSNLYASWEICTDDGGFAVCTYGTARWNIANPINPRLTSLIVTGTNY